ncbi:MAG: hypothetical protein H0W24_01985 [Lysobacter sp.]|nr:hypothetical protein [Lysobacter sp.]MDQ3269448.1 hypothetical protein [Pseudomonadota bacterium]
MNKLMTSSLLPCLLLLAGTLSSCDRRDDQPREVSETTDTVILDPAAADAGATTDPLPPPAMSPCHQMSGQAETECRERERAGEPRRPGELPRETQ